MNFILKTPRVLWWAVANPVFGRDGALSGPRRGDFYTPRGTATTQDQLPKLTWAKTRSFRDDDNFFTTDYEFLPTHQCFLQDMWRCCRK